MQRVLFLWVLFLKFLNQYLLHGSKKKRQTKKQPGPHQRAYSGRVGSGREGPTPCQSYGSDLLLRRLGPTRQSESKSSFTLINKARQRLQVTNLPPESHELMSGNTQKKKYNNFCRKFWGVELWLTTQNMLCGKLCIKLYNFLWYCYILCNYYHNLRCK